MIETHAMHTFYNIIHSYSVTMIIDIVDVNYAKR